MAALTQQDLAQVAKLLERLRDGTTWISHGGYPPVKVEDTVHPVFQRVEAFLTESIRRMDTPLGDGGPAFPCTVDSTQPLGRQVGNTAWEAYGLTMRDYFAGQALVGCFNFWVQVKNQGATIGDPDRDAITELAYEYADAMIRARTALKATATATSNTNGGGNG